MFLGDVILFSIALLTLALVVTVLMHALLKVPYVPTPAWVGRAMVDAAGLKPGDTVYDLGAGDGRLLMQARQAEPGIRAIGCEIVPTVWLLGKIRALLRRSTIDLRLGSALMQDLRDADVLLLYMTSDFLKILLPKLQAELRPGTRIVSHAFRFPGLEPMRRVELKNGWRRAVLHVYSWDPAACGASS